MPESIVQRLHIPVQTRSIDQKKLTVDIVASTPSVDSYGTVIDQAGWDLSQFKRNPVITWAHDDRGFTASEGLPVANAIPETVRVENGQLKMKLRFTPEDVHPFGFRVFRMIAEGFLHGLSVGFCPQDDTTMTDEEGDQLTKFTRCKLLETAVVTIPSNDDALVQRARKLNREADVERIRMLAKEVEEMAKEAKADEKPETPVEQPVEKPEPVTPEAEAPLPEAIQKMAQKMTAEYVQKCISYFEKKQPANKAATKVLKKFYQMRGEDAPKDEIEAWKGVEEKLEEALAVVKAEEAKEEAKVEEKPVDVPVEAPAEAEAPVAPVEEQPVPPEPAPETVPVETPVGAPVDQPADEAPAPEVTPVEAPVEQPAPEVPVAAPEMTVETPAAPDLPPTQTDPPQEAPAPARKAFVQLPLQVLLKLRQGQTAAVREAAEEALRQGVPPDRLVGMFEALRN